MFTIRVYHAKTNTVSETLEFNSLPNALRMIVELMETCKERPTLITLFEKRGDDAFANELFEWEV